VETSPSFAGASVDISSSQLSASCASVDFENFIAVGFNNVSVALDDDGNATVLAIGQNCVPGTDVIEVDLEPAPYDTALGTLVANLPVVTSEGVTGYPTTSGTVTTGEVETGDTTASGESDVWVFYVETNPAYVEQPVEISSDQLEDRCGQGYTWVSLSNTDGLSFSPGHSPGSPAQGILDDDGNTVFLFNGGRARPGRPR